MDFFEKGRDKFLNYFVIFNYHFYCISLELGFILMMYFGCLHYFFLTFHCKCTVMLCESFVTFVCVSTLSDKSFLLQSICIH
jgi:hypothetical protein